MKHDKKSTAGRQQGGGNSQQGQSQSEIPLQNSEERGNEADKTSVVAATLPFDVNGVGNAPETSTQPQTEQVETKQEQAETPNEITPEKPVSLVETKMPVPVKKVRAIKNLGSNIVTARRGNVTASFSQTAWGLMGKDKAGWVEFTPEPPEVTALKNKQ